MSAVKMAKKQVGLSTRQEERYLYSFPSVSICGLSREHNPSAQIITTFAYVHHYITM